MRSITWFIIRLAAPLRRLRSDSKGVVAVVVALTIPVLAGLAALAVDTSVWSSAKNSAQGAADVRGGGRRSRQQLDPNVNEADASSALSGFTNGQNGVTVTVNTPPKFGGYTSSSYKNSAYEVIITQPQTRFLAGLLGAAPMISGRSVALVAGKPACILALEPSASNTIGMSGGASVGAPNCAVASNSSSGTAVSLSGGAALTASNLNIVGNYTISGGATVSATIKTGAKATKDPYGPQGTNLAVPAFSTSPCNPLVSVSGAAKKTITAGCYAGINVSGGSTLTIGAGNYVINGGGGINLSGGSTVNMGPGIYIINADSFTLSGGNTVSASGGKLRSNKHPECADDE